MLVSPLFKTGYELFSKGLDLPEGNVHPELINGFAKAFRVSEGLDPVPDLVVGFPDFTEEEIDQILGSAPVVEYDEEEAIGLDVQSEREMFYQTLNQQTPMMVSWRPVGISYER